MDMIPSVVALIAFSIERLQQVLEVSVIVGTAIGGLYAGSKVKGKKNRRQPAPINSGRGASRVASSLNNSDR